ncbi:SMP-30/gluconolactonase/LRE family protein [Methylopila sp. M107]|uniref:SMP-30/gluconolactonase/LRE family protein n=1 Tax=Methylopila sp. M107 TaxID=1101190 RepID=UPI00036C052A|nr:SMP-30/gluconolactonase/LRE family protein [Methylopila sp. M107]
MTLRHAAFAAAAAMLLMGPAHAAELEKLWEIDGLKQPESALYDASGGVIFVSEVVGDMRAKDGDGQISKVSPEGKVVQSGWVKGLNAPKGLGLSGGKLYAADIDELVEIDVASGKVTARHKVEGAVFLNDIVTDGAGRVYVSDSGTNTISVLESGEVKPWLRNDRLNSPNGLAIEGDAMVVASFGKPAAAGQEAVPGFLVEAPLSGDSVRTLGDGSPIGALDGLVVLGGGKYLATDYIKGGLLRIDQSGSFETLAPLPSGTADLSYDPQTKTAFVPQNKEGKLTAFRIP